MLVRVVAMIGVVLVALVRGAAAPAAPPGTLDPSFGSGGVVTFPVGRLGGLQSMVVQPDGKVVVGGTAAVDLQAVARITVGGTLDASFGTGGIVTTPALAGGVSALVVGSGGSIVAGYASITRYLGDGSLDPGFGSGGIASLPLATLRDLAVLTDGRVLVAGSQFRFTPGGSTTDFMVARYTASGSLDSTFGVGGKVVTDLGLEDSARRLLLLPDGRFVVVAGVTTGNPGAGWAEHAVLMRYLPDGALDPSFGSGGAVIAATDAVLPWSSVDDALLAADGTILVSGQAAGRVAFARYLADGATDPSFGSDGVVVPAVPGRAWAVAQAADAKILATDGNLGVMRLDRSGALDSTFGSGGIATPGIAATGQSLVVDPSGRILVAGTLSPSTSPPTWVVARYLGSQRDTSAPSLALPSPISVDAVGPTGAAVSFTVTATDDVDPVPVVSCAPRSGGVFPIGMTTVRCTATDAAGNSATASFVVRVKGAAEQLADLRVAVSGVGPGKSLAVTVGIAEWLVAHGQRRAACATLAVFGLEVRALPRKKLPVAQAEALIADATRIRNVLGC